MNDFKPRGRESSCHDGLLIHMLQDHQRQLRVRHEKDFALLSPQRTEPGPCRTIQRRTLFPVTIFHFRISYVIRKALYDFE